jgi:1-aminocyclopropane-1-carboxylate deaminase/D-cysteine desulfhydrase-like pyridoxal-dependent ACC family enzyme
LSTFWVGPGAYFIPVGGHTIIGCLGYVQAALECLRQAEAHGLPVAKTTIVTAAGTGGTLAGLTAGLQLLGVPLRVLGLDIGKLWRAFPASLAELVNGLGRALGAEIAIRPDQVPLIERTYAGAGYAAMPAETNAAIQLLAEQEGIILDPVYTGKAFAGLLDLVRIRYFRPGEHIIFLHTGGLPGLWAYAHEF